MPEGRKYVWLIWQRTWHVSIWQHAQRLRQQGRRRTTWWFESHVMLHCSPDVIHKVARLKVSIRTEQLHTTVVIPIQHGSATHIKLTWVYVLACNMLIWVDFWVVLSRIELCWVQWAVLSCVDQCWTNNNNNELLSVVSNTRCHSIWIARIKIRVDSQGRWERA